MDFHDLLIWQKAIRLSLMIYDVTDAFPKEERYGLAAQLRRSGASVPSNIAEGEGRLTPGERRQALSQARGSLYEVETQLVIAAHRRYVPAEFLKFEISDLRRMIDAYIAHVRRGSRHGPTS
jgi:four helix bundle protein